MKRITIIFIVLSLNCLSGYFLDWPLSLFLFRPCLEGLDWNPISQYLLVAVPLAIAFPIVVGDAIFKFCITMKRFLNKEDETRAKVLCNTFIDGFVRFCVIIMLLWAVCPPPVKSFAFDKRSYVFDLMCMRHRGMPIDERDDYGKFREISNFKGIIYQNAGADGIWDTSDDIIRLERTQDEHCTGEQ